MLDGRAGAGSQVFLPARHQETQQELLGETRSPPPSFPISDCCLQCLDDSADGAVGLAEDEVEEHFKADLEETGSLTSQDEAHLGGGLTEPSTHPSEEDGSEASEDNSVIEDVNVLPAHTNYTEDPPEVFGTVSDDAWETELSFNMSPLDRRPNRGVQRGEQVHRLVPHEAGQARHGPVQGGAANIYPGAEVLPGQDLRLLLPC